MGWDGLRQQGAYAAEAAAVKAALESGLSMQQDGQGICSGPQRRSAVGVQSLVVLQNAQIDSNHLSSLIRLSLWLLLRLRPAARLASREEVPAVGTLAPQLMRAQSVR